MKSIIMFIIGIIIGLVLGLKFGYEAVINTTISESQNVLSTVISQWIGSGGQALLGDYQAQANQLIEDQKTQLKQQAQDQLKDYLMKKVDNIF